MKTIAYIRAGTIYDDSRATKEIITLAQAGNKIIVFAWNRDGHAQAKCKEIFKNYINVEFLFFNILLERGIGFKNIFKLFNYINWVNKELKKIEGIDFVHACDLDAGIGAYLFCKKYKIKLIYDIYDYYVDSHTIPRILISIVEKKEIEIINYATTTIICTEERREQIKKSKPRKIVVIHNSPDIQKNKNNNIEYDSVYCGVLDENRLLKEIFNNYSDNSELKFVCAGYGRFREDAEDIALKFENFQFLGAIPYERVLEIEAKARIMTAIYAPRVKFCAPNKFYEALALAKPVIVCRGTGIDKIVEKNNIGLVIDYDVNCFYEAVKQLRNSSQLCLEMGIRARELYDKKYRWTIMEERLLKIYE